VNKTNLLFSKKKRLTKSPPAKSPHLKEREPPKDPIEQPAGELVISAKKRVPGMVPRSKNAIKVATPWIPFIF
jgi:hypothetical protein